MSDSAFVDNAERARYELHRAGRVLSVAYYRRDDDVVTIRHVETEPAERGNGHAARLMGDVLEHLRVNDLRVRPACGFAAAYVRDHPDQHDLLAR